MPGPSNAQKKRKSKDKSSKKKHQGVNDKAPTPPLPLLNAESPPLIERSPRPPSTFTTSATSVRETATVADNTKRATVADNTKRHETGGSSRWNNIPRHMRARRASWAEVPKAPFIHDPGNGPRVRDVHAFLSSKYFAQPPALDDPLCAEFSQKEVLEMLRTVLPEEIALILWYNKSRSTSRICPTCYRLYRLGDVLADHIPGQAPIDGMDSESSPKIQREQIISGLCSPMCFIAASYSYPSAIKSAWGRTAEELDDHTWDLLNGPPEGAIGDSGLTLLMRMTRLDDLGLGQLCLGLDAEDSMR